MTDATLSEQRETPGGLRDFLNVLFKHKASILGIFVATVVTVTVGSFVIAPVYESNASLLVKIGGEYINRPEVGDMWNVMVVNQEEIVNSEIQILTSRELVEKVITSMGIATIYPRIASDPPVKITPFEASVIRFSKDLTAEGVKKSSVIEVSFQHKDPKIAAGAVNMLVDFYKGKHLEVYSGPQSSFLEKQLGDFRQRLEGSENALETFKQKHQVYSLDEQRSLLLRQRVELDTSFKKAKNRIDEFQKNSAQRSARLMRRPRLRIFLGVRLRGVLDA
jgi:uncharacterized protein involved in exopolysaccharide biosynthesis